MKIVAWIECAHVKNHLRSIFYQTYFRLSSLMQRKSAKNSFDYWKIPCLWRKLRSVGLPKIETFRLYLDGRQDFDLNLDLKF